MVSVREIRRIFYEVAPERQLPMTAIIEFQTRAEELLNTFAKLCEEEAGGEDSKARLTSNHVKLAFVNYKDKVKQKGDEE